MLNVQNVTFKGVYNVNFPKNTSQGVIQEKANIAENFLKTICGQSNGYAVKAFDRYIRIVTSTENPWLLVQLFKEIGGEKLAEKYVNEVAININI